MEILVREVLADLHNTAMFSIAIHIVANLRLAQEVAVALLQVLTTTISAIWVHEQALIFVSRYSIHNQLLAHQTPSALLQGLYIVIRQQAHVNATTQVNVLRLLLSVERNIKLVKHHRKVHAPVTSCAMIHSLVAMEAFVIISVTQGLLTFVD